MSSFDLGVSSVAVIPLKESERDKTLATMVPDRGPVSSWKYNYLKRILDVSLGLMILLLFAAPGLVIAVAIALTSRGPVFYRETRIGRYGRPFRIWKFRSMCKPTHLSPVQNPRSSEDDLSFRMYKSQHDPRITPISRFLRRWSLDELPQIINVISGEMSLIGPRPIVEAETCFYDTLLPFYLAAIPGMSGLWQVSGRCDIDYPKRAQLDASYVIGWSLSADIEILMQTLPAVLARTGAR
jgi:exopolysaccharide production protein ExoY